MQTLYVTHPACRLHEMGPSHPECPARLDAIHDQLMASRLLGLLREKTPVAASDADILRVHEPEYMAYLASHAPASGHYALDADTVMNPHTLLAARVAAGAGITAVDMIMGGQATTAFCAVRPPGHHACRNHAMGFCFFNNLAIAVAYVLEKYALQRVAIIDFDVHHGNGTEEIFASDSRVLMCSFFQHPFFPGSGASGAASNMVNIPVPAYTTGVTIRQLVMERWLPRLREFDPQFLFVSAGFDAHREDSIGQLGLDEGDYAWLTRQLVTIAGGAAHGRIVSFLEGGYNLSALGRSAVAHIRELAAL